MNLLPFWLTLVRIVASFTCERSFLTTRWVHCTNDERFLRNLMESQLLVMLVDRWETHFGSEQSQKYPELCHLTWTIICSFEFIWLHHCLEQECFIHKATTGSFWSLMPILFFKQLKKSSLIQNILEFLFVNVFQ